jgi:hypothetical protein
MDYESGKSRFLTGKYSLEMAVFLIWYNTILKQGRSLPRGAWSIESRRLRPKTYLRAIARDFFTELIHDIAVLNKCSSTSTG